MQAWLYQMSNGTAEDWSPESYRVEVWEGKQISWPVGHINSRGLGEITPGDFIVLFYAKTKNDYPGIYGWGIVLDYSKRRNRIEYQAIPPSDYLKADPIWDDKVEKWIDQIRGKMRQGTMWGISGTEFTALRNIIRNHARPRVA